MCLERTSSRSQPAVSFDPSGRRAFGAERASAPTPALHPFIQLANPTSLFPRIACLYHLLATLKPHSAIDRVPPPPCFLLRLPAISPGFLESRTGRESNPLHLPLHLPLPNGLRRLPSSFIRKREGANFSWEGVWLPPHFHR